MSKRTGTTKVRFANNHTEDGQTYKQGEVYDVTSADARDFVRRGKAQYVHPNTKTTDEPAPAGESK